MTKTELKACASRALGGVDPDDVLGMAVVFMQHSEDDDPSGGHVIGWRYVEQGSRFSLTVKLDCGCGLCEADVCMDQVLLMWHEGNK